MPYVKDLLLLQPTSPLRKTQHIDEIFKLRSKFKTDSAVSISLAKSNIIFRKDAQHKIKPINNQKKFLPRQKFNDLYTLNGALYLSSRESILGNRSFLSPSTVGYVMSEEHSIDIDTPLDWEIAEYLMRKKL